MLQQKNTITSPLAQYLLNAGMINRTSLEIAVEQSQITGEDLGIVLVRNSFIRQSDLTAAVLEADPEQIFDETAIVPSIDPKKLIETNTVMVAETPTRLYAATLSQEYEVAQMIAETDPRPVEFVPLNIEKLDEYMADLERQISSDDDSLIDRLIRRALNQGVSDLHIMPQAKTYIVLQRRLGVRERLHQGDMDEFNVLVARIKDRAKMDLSERRRPQDGAFQVEHKKRMIDLRVASSPTVFGEYVVIRLLDPDAIKPDLSQLGITGVDNWRKGINRTSGLCLVCGPTGSGKTTTLNSTMREIDRIEKALFTIENPVEYQTPFTAQVNVNEAVGLGFDEGLRAFMRQDPDIIMAGEIRDAITARIAVKGAETGHNMIATLHSSTPRGAVNRLRDLGVAPYELRDILRTILVQRLIRVFCTHCHGEGCNHCNGSGFGGRTIVSESVYFPDENSVERLLNGERWWPSMVEDAVLKYKQNMTSENEIIRVFGPEGEDALARMT